MALDFDEWRKQKGYEDPVPKEDKQKPAAKTGTLSWEEYQKARNNGASAQDLVKPYAKRQPTLPSWVITGKERAAMNAQILRENAGIRRKNEQAKASIKAMYDVTSAPDKIKGAMGGLFSNKSTTPKMPERKDRNWEGDLQKLLDARGAPQAVTLSDGTVVLPKDQEQYILNLQAQLGDVSDDRSAAQKLATAGDRASNLYKNRRITAEDRAAAVDKLLSDDSYEAVTQQNKLGNADLDWMIENTESQMASLPKDSDEYAQLAYYATYLRRVRSGYNARADFYGQFQGENDYNRNMEAAQTAEKGLYAVEQAGRSHKVYYDQTVASAEAAKKKWQALQEKANDARLAAQEGTAPGENGVFAPVSQEELERREREAQRLEAAAHQAFLDYQQAALVSQYAYKARYSDLQSRDDFEEMAAIGRSLFEPKRQSIETSRTQNKQNIKQATAGNGAGMFVDGDKYSYRTPIDAELTPEQENIWYYLYAKNPEEAYEYARQCTRDSKSQTWEARMQEQREAGGRNALTRTGSFAAGILSFPFAGLDYLSDVAQYAETGTIMPRDQLSVNDYTDAWTQGSAAALNEKYETLGEGAGFLAGKGWGDVYQLGQSVGQSLAVAGLGGGPTNALFFFSAARQGAEEAMQRGAAPGQALTYGAMTGLAEVLGETLSVENLVHMDASTPLLRNILTQAAIEGSEEGMTTLMNTFFDEIVMKDKSELNQQIYVNMANGMDYETAVRSAWKSWGNDLAVDVIGGMISGGLSTSAHTVGSRTIQNIKKANTQYTGDAQNLLQMAQLARGNIAVDLDAARAEKEFGKKKSISVLAAERLAESTSKAINEADKPALVKDVAEKLQESNDGRWSDRQVQQKAEKIVDAVMNGKGVKFGTTIEQNAFEELQMQLQGRNAPTGNWADTRSLKRTQAQEIAAGRAVERATEDTRQSLKSAFEDSKLDLSEQDLGTLTEGWIPGVQDKTDYVLAMRDAYRLGKAGMTLAQAADSSDNTRAVFDVQFEHAWELGARAGGYDPGKLNGTTHQAQKETTVSVEGLGDDLRIQGIRSDRGDSAVMVETKDGEVMPVLIEDVDFGESGLGDLVQKIRGREDAQLMFDAYQSGTDIGSFVAAWDAAKAYGKKTARAKAESVMNDPALQGVSPEVIRAAFEAGRQERAAEKAARAEKETEKTGKQAPAKNGKYVTFEGGTVDGVKLAAVDKAKLSRKQRAQIAAVSALAEERGIRIVFFQSSADRTGRYQGAYGMYKDGVIYIDVNAGMRGRNIGQVAIVRTAAHELTHYIQDLSEERYQELQDFLLDHLAEWKGKSLGDLAAEKQARSEQELTMEEALDEVICDGCEMMLNRASVMEQMAEENNGLFKVVKSWLKKWVAQVQAAFEGVIAVHEEARAVEAMEAERLRKFTEMWYKGLFEASEAAKSPATEGGETKYSVREGMSEEERYDELKDRTITAKPDTASAQYEEALNKIRVIPRAKRLAEKVLIPLAKDLGILNRSMKTPEVDIDFVFSKNGGLAESMYRQNQFGGDYEDFAKALINIDSILEDAVLIERHGDKYKGTTRENPNLENVSVLLGAFNDGGYIVPVQFEIKKTTDTGGRLYMTVALTKIKADVLGRTSDQKASTPSLLSASTYNIADVFKEIKPEDARFLKYVPDGFLNDEQKAAKQRAIEADKEKIDKLRKEKPAQHQDREPYDGVEEAAVEHFGTTNNFRAAGYILSDGRMLDFSGAHWLEGYDQNYIAKWKQKNDIRQVDHEDVFEAFEQITEDWPSDSALAFINRGNIRMVPEAPGIELARNREPSAAQYRQIKAFIRTAMNDPQHYAQRFNVDFTIDRTHRAGVLSYTGKVNPDRVINDMKHFYQTGEIRKQSGLSAFYQDREDLPEDRELLMAAKAEGRNAEALEAYKKKVKALEALQRKLQRQQDALQKAKGDKNAEAVQEWQKKIEKTEASILRAEKALDGMERSPELKKEAEKALTAWREANPHEAAKALREMRQEQESLRKYVELLKQEARLTTPENRKLLPSDVRKLAQALVKEQGSEANVDSITEQLQKLGDFMASNIQGAGADYYGRIVNAAKKIARQIVEQAYETIDDNKEIYQGVREYLRNHTLNSEDVRGDIPDFDSWRKSHMGTLRLGKDGISIDQAYHDLQASYGEGFFREDIMAASDQLYRILDVLDMTQPSYHQMYSTYDAWQASEALGNEIVDRLLSGEVRERESMADQAFQRRMKQLEEKYARKDKARQKALENAEDRAAWEARKRDEAEERRREERALRRQLVAEKVHELRERSIDRDKRYRGRIAIDKKVVALSKIMLKNSGKRHVPDAWKEVVGNFLGSIDTLTQHSGEKSRSFHLERIEALRDMAAKQQLRNEGKDDSGPQVFMDLNPYVAEMLAPFLKMARDSSTGMIEVERLSLEEMRQLEDVLTALREAVDKSDKMLAAAEKGETLSGTAGETVEYLDKLGKGKTGGTLKRFLSWDNLTPVYFFSRFGTGGEKVFRELQKGWGKLAFNAKDIIKFAEGTYTEKEAKEWEKETHEFELVKREADLSGRESLTKAAKEGGPEAVQRAEEKNKTTVKISTAQLMGIYCLMQREQARGHILQGGIRIWDIEGKRGKTTEQAERYLVTPEDLANMENALTDRQKKVAKALQKYMNTVGSAWGNEVSQARYGVDLFTEPNYYPISTDPMSRNARTPEADSSDLYHLLNMGFTKNTVKNARNGLVIHSIFDVFANHMADMAKYNAMGLPMLDAMKWFNYVNDDPGGSFTSVRQAIEKAYGKNAEKYFLAFIQDLNGQYEGGRRGEDVGAKLISNMKVASVGANLRVAFLQPTSYVRAMAVLDPKYMLKFSNWQLLKGREEALKYSGTAQWKDLGFFDVNIQNNLRDMIKHTDGTMDKLREASMVGAEWGDKLTWGALWNACKAQTKAETGLSGEELLRATADRFDDVIYRTQVMDSTMTRSHMMRAKGNFASMVTSFMSEPTLSYNLLLDSIVNWQNAKRSGTAMKAAWGVVGRAFVTYALSQIVASLVESIFDALRDDDDYEDFLTKWKQAEFGFDGNLVEDLAPWNKLPYLRDLVSIAQGYNNKRMDTEWMEYWMNAINAIRSDVKNGNLTWNTAYKAMRALGTMTGLPGSNAGRDAVALWNTFVAHNVPDWKMKNIHFSHKDVKAQAAIKQAFQAGAMSEEDAVRYLMRDAGIKTEDKAKQLVFEWALENGEKKYDKLLAAAKAGDSAGSKAAQNELLAAGFTERQIQTAVREQAKKWYQGTAEDGSPRIDKDKAVRILTEQGGMSRTEAEARVREWSSYVSSPEHLQYDEIKDAYLAGEISESRAVEMRKLYGGKSDADAKAEVAYWRFERDNPGAGMEFSEFKSYEATYKPIGLSVEEYQDFREKLKTCKGADADGDGKTDSGSKKAQVVDLIDGLSLTKKQKDALYLAQNYAESGLKDCPWH